MYVYEVAGMVIYQYVWDVFDSNSYVVAGDQSILVIDPVDSEELYKFVSEQGRRKAIIVLTHGHFDHICGLEKLRGLVQDSCVIATKSCSEKIQDSKKNLSCIADAVISLSDRESVGTGAHVEPFSTKPANIAIKGKFRFWWESREVRLFPVYGHSEDSLLVLVDEQALFTGDTLLPIPTITRLLGGSTHRFYGWDIPLLQRLVPRVELVFPGHRMPGLARDMLDTNLHFD